MATVVDALRFNPTTALVGVATQGGRFPPAWIDLLKTCIANGLHIENGLHVFLADDTELSDLASRHGVELRDLGPHQLKDLDRPERIHQLVLDGLPDSFPPLKAPQSQPDAATPFEGREVVGAPAYVLSRGKVVVENGKFTGKPGDGKFQKRATFGP